MIPAREARQAALEFNQSHAAKLDHEADGLTLVPSRFFRTGRSNCQKAEVIRMRVTNIELGLELTNNSKTGPSFSLSRRYSCINKTDECARACYGNGIRYQSDGAIAKRRRNFETVEYLLNAGGPALLAEHLVEVIDHARPSGWLIAKSMGITASVPFTLRLQDVGDFHSPDYVKAWQIAADHRHQCSIWFYTRSFVDDAMFSALSALASLPNVQGWLSIDIDNFELGIQRYNSASEIWKVAFMQPHPDKANAVLLNTILTATPPADLMIFPEHRAGHHVPPVRIGSAPVCPQVLGALPLETDPHRPKPCQSCRLCLP